MRTALRTGGLLRAWALGLAMLAAALGACASEQDDGGTNSGPIPREWTSGGQTGSLMPACGLSAAAMESGVPASAPGVVLRTDACGDPSAFDELTVRDASGQSVGYSLLRLPDGSLLISVHGGLAPGRYRIEAGNGPVQDGGLADDDAGSELDASLTEPPDAGATGLDVVVEVAELPRPQRFGTIERLGDACNADLTFLPDAAVLPFLSVLSIELQIDEGPLEPLVRPGALPVNDDGIARVRLPTARIDAAGDGFHELRIVTRIAGESVPLETFLMSAEVPCGFSDDGLSGVYGAEDDGRCSVRALGASGSSAWAGALVMGSALFALRKRRRR